MSEPISRRDFLQTTAAGTLLSVGSALAGPEADLGGAEGPALQTQDGGADRLFDRPRRWCSLRGRTIGPFDPKFGSTTSAAHPTRHAQLGGIVAYYPTRCLHTGQRRSRQRSFGALVAGCRDLKMNVVARTDPHAVRDEVRKAHPDWIAVDGKGEPVRHWANPALWVTCALGPYNFEFMDQVHREIVTKYRVDGIFANRWAPQAGTCYLVLSRRTSSLRLAWTARSDPANVDRQYQSVGSHGLIELWQRWAPRCGR